MKKAATLLVLALAAAALVACGDDEGTSTTTTSETTGTSESAAGGAAGGGGATVSFESDPGGNLAYTSDTASTKAGQVTIDFENPQALSHDVAIEGPEGKEIGKTDIVSEGSATTTVELEPGEYTFYCTVPGHREAGMEGTLTVE